MQHKDNKMNINKLDLNKKKDINRTFINEIVLLNMLEVTNK